MNGAAAGIWDWSYAREALPALLDGLAVTLEATALAFAFALVVGMVWAVMRRSERRAVRGTARWIVEAVRSTPLLVQLYFIFYVFPEMGLVLSPLVAPRLVRRVERWTGRIGWAPARGGTTP